MEVGYLDASGERTGQAILGECRDQGADPTGLTFEEGARKVTVWQLPEVEPDRAVARKTADGFQMSVSDRLDSHERAHSSPNWGSTAETHCESSARPAAAADPSASYGSARFSTLSSSNCFSRCSAHSVAPAAPMCGSLRSASRSLSRWRDALLLAIRQDGVEDAPSRAVNVVEFLVADLLVSLVGHPGRALMRDAQLGILRFDLTLGARAHRPPETPHAVVVGDQEEYLLVRHFTHRTE